MKESVSAACSLFFLLCVLLVPFPLYLLPYREEIAEALFGKLIVTEISSDSKGIYMLVLVLFTIALSAGVISWRKPDAFRKKLTALSRQVCCYFLALCFFKYGFDKVFKAQFYLPEPNILYTPLGQVSKDLLFWSAMGSSHAYNVFMGTLEVIPAVLLFFRKTRVLGLLLALGVMVNVIAINFSYDISVKVFSVLLLGMILFLLVPAFTKLYGFFVLQRESRLEPGPEQRSGPRSFKLLAIAFIFTEALFPYLKGMNFNDDTVPRPALHGAYEVTGTGSSLKRIFIHRKGYMVLQDTADRMEDFKLEIDSVQNRFFITDYEQNTRCIYYRYDKQLRTLDLRFQDETGDRYLGTKYLEWKELPLLQNEFHWTVD
jgi:hypothetical protein